MAVVHRPTQHVGDLRSEKYTLQLKEKTFFALKNSDTYLMK